MSDVHRVYRGTWSVQRYMGCTEVHRVYTVQRYTGVLVNNINSQVIVFSQLMSWNMKLFSSVKSNVVSSEQR